MTRCAFPGCRGRMMSEVAYEKKGVASGAEILCMLCGRPEGYTDPPSTPIPSCLRPGCLDLASPTSPEGECPHHLTVRNRTAVVETMTEEELRDLMQPGKPGRPRKAV